MKIYIFLKIAVLLFCAFSSTQLNGGILINGNAKEEKSANTKPSQNTEEITITAISEIGTYPEFKGLAILLDQLKENVVYALTGKTPYRIKSNINDGTVKASKQGNKLMLEVTLIPCEESERHYFFDGAAGIYSYINTTSFSSVEGKVRKAVMEKANVSFSGTQPQEAYPNHFELKDFTNLNTVEPNKEYKLILKFLVGKRPGGYFDLRDEKQEEIDRKIFNENQLLYSNQSKVYLPIIRRPILADINIENKQKKSLNENTSVPNNMNKKNIKIQEQVPKKIFACDLEIKTELYKAVGNYMGLKVEFTNHSKKIIDNINFTVVYYNIYGDYLGNKSYTWEPGLINGSVIKPNTNLTTIFPTYLKSDDNIKKYNLTPIRLHYTDDTFCIF